MQALRKPEGVMSSSATGNFGSFMSYDAFSFGMDPNSTIGHRNVGNIGNGVGIDALSPQTDEILALKSAQRRGSYSPTTIGDRGAEQMQPQSMSWESGGGGAFHNPFSLHHPLPHHHSHERAVAVSSSAPMSNSSAVHQSPPPPHILGLFSPASDRSDNFLRSLSLSPRITASLPPDLGSLTPRDDDLGFLLSPRDSLLKSSMDQSEHDEFLDGMGGMEFEELDVEIDFNTSSPRHSFNMFPPSPRFSYSQQQQQQQHQQHTGTSHSIHQQQSHAHNQQQLHLLQQQLQSQLPQAAMQKQMPVQGQSNGSLFSSRLSSHPTPVANTSSPSPSSGFEHNHGVPILNLTAASISPSSPATPSSPSQSSPTGHLSNSAPPSPSSSSSSTQLGDLDGVPYITSFGEHPYGEHPSRTLFVRNINSNVEDEELTTLFETYGPIRSMYTQCKHRGFVMISYFDIRHAKNAMRHLQGKLIRRRKLDIHYSIPKDNPSEKDQNQGTLVVFNLDPSTTNEELKTTFGQYGEIKEIRETPNKKHHKFIEFYDVRDAEKAMKHLNKTEIKSKKIKIEPSRPGGARKNQMNQLAFELSEDDSPLGSNQSPSPLSSRSNSPSPSPSPSASPSPSPSPNLMVSQSAPSLPYQSYSAASSPNTPLRMVRSPQPLTKSTSFGSGGERGVNGALSKQTLDQLSLNFGDTLSLIPTPANSSASPRVSAAPTSPSPLLAATLGHPTSLFQPRQAQGNITPRSQSQGNLTPRSQQQQQQQQQQQPQQPQPSGNVTPRSNQPQVQPQQIQQGNLTPRSSQQQGNLTPRSQQQGQPGGNITPRSQPPAQPTQGNITPRSRVPSTSSPVAPHSPLSGHSAHNPSSVSPPVSRWGSSSPVGHNPLAFMGDFPSHLTSLSSSDSFVSPPSTSPLGAPSLSSTSASSLSSLMSMGTPPHSPILFPHATGLGKGMRDPKSQSPRSIQLPLPLQQTSQYSFQDQYSPHLEQHTPRQDQHTPRQDQHTPRQDQHTPRQDQHTPRQDQHTPRQDGHTPRQDQHTPRQDQHTPRQDQHTPRQDQHTPRQDQHTPRQDAGQPPNNKKPQQEDKSQYIFNVERVRQGLDQRTTLMIRNIPNKYSQKMLLAAVDEQHKGTYDFFYLPIDFKNKCNMGYAFINFISCISLEPFYEEFNNQKWGKFNSEKKCEITYARIQGKAALIDHFQSSSLMKYEDKKCRPIIFHSEGPNQGEQKPFPIPIPFPNPPGAQGTPVPPLALPSAAGTASPSALSPSSPSHPRRNSGDYYSTGDKHFFVGE